MTKEEKIGATEILELLKHFPETDVQKIPREFIRYLESLYDKDYIPKLDYTKPLNEIGLSKDAKILLVVIYRNFWCSKDRIAEVDDKLKRNNKK